MDAGQITQGMRAQVMQQAAAQGINVDQMMENGMSFMDVMMMIVSGSSGGQLTGSDGILFGQQQSQTEIPQDGTELLNSLFAENETGKFISEMALNKADGEVLTILNGEETQEEKTAVNSGQMKDYTYIKADSDEKTEISRVETAESTQEAAKTVDGERLEKPSSIEGGYEKTLLSDNREENNLPVSSREEQLSLYDSYDENSSPVVSPEEQSVNPPEDFPQMTEKTEMWSFYDSNGFADEGRAVFNESGLTQQLEKLFSVVSPEIMKASQQVSSDGLTNGQRFMMDLMKESSDSGAVKDSFDFSEDILKVDPMQLAGLLDFIGTGTAIPIASDLSDSQIFKNTEPLNIISEKVLFDPDEMIRSGEMEIVSYVPASKGGQSGQMDSRSKDEETIGFARTMKSVRENVKPLRGSLEEDEYDTRSKVGDSDGAVTFEQLDSTVERKDISFERAYAELEMNKAKYGSADEQLAKGIAENIGKGRSEFTVKLRPEGLGEILVKLTSDSTGKAVLSMVASSEKTAQLLNRDLSSLQASLSNHNVEIDGNRVKTTETVVHAESNFNQFDERRQDEGNQENQYRQLREKLGTDNLKIGSAEYGADEPLSRTADDSALNIRI